MHNGKWPASEVVRRLEDDLQSAAVLRTRAEAMLAEAAEKQRRVYDMAVEHLGMANGEAAYNLACLTSNTDPSLRASSVHDAVAKAAPPPASAIAVPVLPPPEETVPAQAKRADAPASPRAVPLPSVPTAVASPPRTEPDSDGDADEGQDDPSRLVLHGVEIKRAKYKEAEEVVAQARSAAAQGHKANPYAGQRGRNSWRDALYAAAYAAALGEGHARPSDSPDMRTPPPALRQPPIEASVPAAAPTEAPVASAERAPPSARAVPYTRNPAQSAVQARPVQDAPPPAADRPSEQAVTVPAGEVMHRPQPISGRVVALGQASPMPDGLKEEVERREGMRSDSGPAPAAPVPGPVTALKPLPPKPLPARRPSFLNR